MFTFKLSEKAFGRKFVMSLNQWKYKDSNSRFVELESWMNFSMELATYTKTQNKQLKIYISVPSGLLFSYFFALSCIEYDFKNPTKELLLKNYLGLKEGQRILYRTGEEWIAHSVIKVGTFPDTEKKAIIIKDRSNSITYIPEERWFTHVRIHVDGTDKIKNIRRVKNIENIIDNEKLRKLYSEENLNLLMMQNTAYTLLFANKNEWRENLSVIALKNSENIISMNELFFDGTEGTFKNFQYIQRDVTSDVHVDAAIILLGSNRGLRMLHQFVNHKCIIIVDQHESEERVEELQNEIKNDVLTNNALIFNNELREYMERKSVEIPKGVEVFAWVSKS